MRMGAPCITVRLGFSITPAEKVSAGRTRRPAPSSPSFRFEVAHVFKRARGCYSTEMGLNTIPRSARVKASLICRVFLEFRHFWSAQLLFTLVES